VSGRPSRRASSLQCVAETGAVWLLGVGDWLEQGQRVEIQLAGDALQALEGQVALASLDAADVGAVDAEDIGEVFLADAVGVTVGPEVAAKGVL
jgi:hypothetical protein